MSQCIHAFIHPSDVNTELELSNLLVEVQLEWAESVLVLLVERVERHALAQVEGIL